MSTNYKQLNMIKMKSEGIWKWQGIFSDIFNHYSLNHFHEALFMKVHY